MPISLRLAGESDLSDIVMLMNAAFRGTESWSIEGAYIDGDRTNAPLLKQEIADGAWILLKRDETTLRLQGCVSLQPKSPDTWYLGSLTVDPAIQNSGFGREMLCAAEEYAQQRGARSIEMTVVNVRDTLIAWYERRGYQQTGERRPFPYSDRRYGVPTRDDLEFVVLSRDLTG